MISFQIIYCFIIVVWSKPQYNYDSEIQDILGGFSRGLISATFQGLPVRNSENNDDSSESFSQESSTSVSRSITAENYVDSRTTGSSLFFDIGEETNTFSAIPSHYQDVSASHDDSQYEAPFVHKQFITVTAPVDDDSLSQSKNLVVGRPQINYRVVFIKASSASNSNVKLSTEYAPKEEKTIIYVLTKKDNTLEVNDIATPAPTVASKPEVFFIKYKTDQEAQHAQREIQGKYYSI